MNQPYVVQRDAFGKIINPIERFYANEFANRRQRREQLHPKRFIGNHKGISLSSFEQHRFIRAVQYVFEKPSKTIFGRVAKNQQKRIIKRIEHYLSATNN